MANDTWTGPSGPAAGTIILAEMQAQRTDNLFVIEQVIFNGDVSASGKVHRHKSGALVDRPTPGNAGRLYFPTDIGLQLVDDGTEWLIGQHFSQKCAHLDEDFILSADEQWKITNTGTGSVAQVVGHGGIVELSTGATSGSNARLLNNTSNGGSLDPGKIHLAFYILNFEDPAATSQHFIGGWLDAVPTGATNPNDGIFLRKIDAGNVFGVCRIGNVETTVDLGSTMSAETLVIVERTATGVQFYVGTFNAAGKKGSEITTNIPTATQILGFRHNNSSVAISREMRLNATRLWAAR